MQYWNPASSAIFLIFSSFFSFAAYGQAASVAVALNANGLTSLRYGTTEYLGYGDFRLNAIQFRNSSGQIVNGSTSATSSLAPARQQVTRQYAWGTVKISYVASGNRLSVTIATSNSSPDPIVGLFYEPLAIRFPSTPSQYDGNTPILGHNIGNPTVLTMTHGANALTLVNEDVYQPLMAGFPFALDRPSPMLLFPLRVNTGVEPTYPTSLPPINRPIAPGATDTYRLSLRFGPSSQTQYAAASDVYASFAARYPKRLNWPDRRAIGSLIIATAATGWAKNPRGWLLDPSIDVTTPAGVAAFRTRILAWADNAVAILRNMNAQGMITWDIEGEQYPHPVTYAGDPRMFAALAPEMAGIADEYFQKFRDAGLRVGVCIRPQQLSVSNGSAAQNEVADPAALLIDKIGYAKSRWGASLFYIDSNGDPSLPTAVEVMAQVAAAHPDVLLIPEHQNLAYFSLAAPYDELRGGIAATPALTRTVYPSAFTVVNTADGPIDERYNDLKTGVSQGDSLMFRGWFDDPANAKVKSLYPSQPDAVPPTVTLLAPGNNQRVAGLVPLQASASDNTGVAGVRFLVDGQPVGAELTQAPYSSSFDSRLLTNGVHSVTVIARDLGGLTATASVQVIVFNRASPLTAATTGGVGEASGSLPWSVQWDSAGLTHGTYLFTVTAEDFAARDGIRVAGVRFLLDGGPIGDTVFQAPYSIGVDTSLLPAGPHQVTAVALDAGGGTARSVFSIFITAPGW